MKTMAVVQIARNFTLYFTKEKKKPTKEKESEREKSYKKKTKERGQTKKASALASPTKLL